MSIRCDNRAIAPGAGQARPAAALILNLLLISPWGPVGRMRLGTQGVRRNPGRPWGRIRSDQAL